MGKRHTAQRVYKGDSGSFFLERPYGQNVDENQISPS